MKILGRIKIKRRRGRLRRSNTGAGRASDGKWADGMDFQGPIAVEDVFVFLAGGSVLILAFGRLPYLR